MANTYRFMSAMLTLTLFVMVTLDFTVAQTGVCYGMIGGNLPNPGKVVALYRQNNISRMRLYDPNQAVLEALRGSNIELILGVPNNELKKVAESQEYANSWVQTNVKNHPNVRFKYIAVGNEVSPIIAGTSQYVQFVLPAMRNVNKAISAAGLGIKVSTAIETGVLEKSFPPADGVLRSDVKSYLNPIISFLVGTRAPLLVNLYTYFSYTGSKGRVNLNYALLQPNSGITVRGGIRYENLFYAMLDAMYAALEKSGGSNVEIVVSESGWPSAGGGDATTVPNARIYNNNLIQLVKSGTPRRLNRAIETYIFAMFDENQKVGPETERNFGLFRPNGQAKYPVTFN